MEFSIREIVAGGGVAVGHLYFVRVIVEWLIADAFNSACFIFYDSSSCVLFYGVVTGGEPAHLVGPVGCGVDGYPGFYRWEA